MSADSLLRSVLVVDDDPDINFLVSMHFKCSGKWQVLSAHDGRSALELARSHRVDVALVDVMLPGMAGPEVSRRLVQIHEHLSVIVMTAGDNAFGLTDDAWYARFGAKGMIAKPFHGRSLVAQVEELLAPPARDERASHTQTKTAVVVDIFPALAAR